MPIKKKRKYRKKIIFWALAAIIAALMIYVPKIPNGAGQLREYELH
jgi:hypothetical protein